VAEANLTWFLKGKLGHEGAGKIRKWAQPAMSQNSSRRLRQPQSASPFQLQLRNWHSCEPCRCEPL